MEKVPELPLGDYTFDEHFPKNGEFQSPNASNLFVYVRPF